MIWTVITSSVTAIASIYFGHQRLFFLYQISGRRLAITGMIAALVYTLLMFLYRLGIVSEAFGAAIITNVYASIFGFFLGSAIEQYQRLKSSGNILYSNRTFMSYHAPVIMAVVLILFGIYRTSLLSQLPITPIRITSGLSFMAVGFWGMTLRLVPEFRQKGIIILDELIPWKTLINYSWFLEEVIELEYEQGGVIKSYKTLIPPEDQLAIEDVLKAKMKEKMEKQ